MACCLRRKAPFLPMLGVLAAIWGVAGLHADPLIYEPGTDPGVGFNLVSWGNFANGTQVWENAVQAAFDAGFDDVSLSPIRFFTPGTGSIAVTSSSGPELAHVAAGVVRAKQLGMRVTVNPFIEPVGFTNWRGFYNPTPNSAEWTTFWNDYEDYLVEVATMAQTTQADSMTVGTELRALELNTGNHAKWDQVIDAVNATYTHGTIGYASNWDSYNSANTAAAIWDHPAIDYVGIDSYFQNLLSAGQADGSGDYPNINFITQVENAWNNKLDNEILPFAAARKGGLGMPVVFTEIGYLPNNRTTVTPQGESQPLDRDEQNMAFEGLMRALDGRQADGDFLAAHIWQWDMQGSSGSLWNMNPSGGNQPNNQQTAQWLSSFMLGTNPDPGDPPVPPPPGATQVLYSFETGLDGFHYPDFESEPPSSVARAGGPGNTHGDFSMAVNKPTGTWTWDARVNMGGDQLQALQEAVADNDDDYVLEMDVTYVAASLPTSFAGIDMHLSMQTNLDSWTQLAPFAAISGATSQTIRVEVPLSAFDLTAGLSSASFHLGFRNTSGGPWTGSATIYLDRIALTDLTFVPPENANFDGDDDVDGADFLAWQIGFGITEGADLSDGDANGDGAVNELDLAIWEEQFGTTGLLTVATAAVPEPATLLSLALALGLCYPRRCRVTAAV